jgi:hypothetical protein
MEWLKRAQYDVVITDLNREDIRDHSARCQIRDPATGFLTPYLCERADDPGDVCSGDKSEKREAGCRLLNRIGVCLKNVPDTTTECN